MDGVNPFVRNQFDIFTVRMTDGSALRSDAFVGLADIDGDDYTDICLRLNPGEAEQIQTLTMNCDMSNPMQRIALPHGNLQGFAPCTDTQPQIVAHVRCPGSHAC